MLLSQTKVCFIASKDVLWFLDPMRKIKKALIPAAGLGTRFLPASKTIPKEMFPIVDTPIILYVIEEALQAGIEDIVLITGRGKSAIEDFFDTSYELEDKLIKAGKINELKKIHDIRNKVNIISVRQKEAKGLGHAVYCGQSVIGKDPFAVLLGDEIISPPTVTQELCQTFSDTGISSVAVMEISPENISKYGVVTVESFSEEKNQYKVLNVIEKPSADKAPSNLALPGRYVFDNRIFSYLEKTSPGKNGEIQLTDAMVQLAENEGLLAQTFTSQRYDAGDKLGYLQANIEFALKDTTLEQPLKKYLKGLVGK